jgi:dTDP-4-amino-4,6-dideoxygalactose transaminase
MQVKFTDLYKGVENKNKILKKIISLIKKNQFVGGEELNKFEKEFSYFTGSKYCVTVANGTDALYLAIKSLGLKRNSEVIVPVNTWISTAEAVQEAGLKVIFCDIDLKDYSICLKDLKKKINKKTKLIMPVHLYGNPADMNSIKEIIKNKDIKIIEDCAQAHGSKIKNKHVGSFGDIGTFSFFPGKNLGCFGDGGAIITNNKKYYEYVLRARNHGALNKYDHKFSGQNSRLDTIQAGVLRIKLKNYKNLLKKRRLIAEIYYKKLTKISKIELFKLRKDQLSCYHQFVIRTNDRDKLQKFLKKSGISTMIHYPYMLNELPFFNYKKKIINAHNLGKKIISLPISEEHSLKEINYVCEKIALFYKK